MALCSELPVNLNIPRSDPIVIKISGEISVFGSHYFGPHLSFEKYDPVSQHRIQIGNMLYYCVKSGYVSFRNSA